MGSGPLTLPEFGARLAAIGGFEVRPLIAVAVSGGPDSMALMLLADRWARTRGGEAWGLTVDHGLRRESAEEALTVSSWLAARAIPHEILRWVGANPTSGIQEAAREARYSLLTAWCRKRFCLHLLTAHHLEDQIETHLIRRGAGSGIDGLAGMSAVRELPGCRLLRPLLSISRRRLAALLATESQPFLSDPSNLNPAFERARLRLETTILGDVAQAVRACALARIAREQALDALIARAVMLHQAGVGVLDPAMLAAADPETAARLLSRVVGCLGGARYPARGVRLARLRTALVGEPRRTRTLGGCRFIPWRGRVLILRELALAEAPITLEPGAALRWDRRFAVALSSEAAGAVAVGYLGQFANAAPEGGFGRKLPPLIHSVLPAIWDGQGVASVPHLDYARPGPLVLPKLLFRPIKPLTPPSFTVV